MASTTRVGRIVHISRGYTVAALQGNNAARKLQRVT